MSKKKEFFRSKSEKKSSFNQIKKDKENPFNICFENWRRIVYSNHPYAFNTNGNSNDVSKITYEDVLLEFENFKTREKYLISNNPEINGENFGTLEKKILKEKSGRVNHNLSANNRFDFINNDSNQTIIMMGDQTCSRRSSEYLPLKVLESYLSYGMSAALFQLFREKHGITYDLGVYYPIRSENAPFLIYLSVSNDQALFAFKLLSKLWKNLLLNPLTNAEIFLAKEKLKGSFLLGNQSLDEILQREIQLISYGISPISEIDLNLKIEEISSLCILKLTNKYFSKPFLSISGNEKICLEISNMWKKNF